MRRVLASVLVGAALLALAAGPCAAPAALAAGEPPADAAANGDPLAGGAVAPDGAPGSRGPMLVVLRIAELLHLSDEQTIKVASEFRRVAQRRRELVAQKASLVTKLEGLLAQKPLDDAALTSATEQLIAVEHELGLLPEGLWKSIQPARPTRRMSSTSSAVAPKLARFASCRMRASSSAVCGAAPPAADASPCTASSDVRAQVASATRTSLGQSAMFLTSPRHALRSRGRDRRQKLRCASRTAR